MTPSEIVIIKTYMCVYIVVLALAKVQGGAKWFIFFCLPSGTDELCVGWFGLTGQYYALCLVVLSFH